MIELKYKTRWKSSPKDKPRVYFSCKKEDFKYFEDIAKDILEKQDCAIFYYDKFDKINKEDLLDYELQLSQMQMFVFPITTKFLTEKNRSLDLDFKIAIDNNIPVLPLMQENGLAELFKEKCGRLQYLNKFKKDDTAISYDKKLTDFLNSVLISNELAEKIRKAFDAYIFLSYRKKDRFYANEVMKEIHKNDFARDIAIWFDEFLVPGQDFSEAIQNALNKSDLFALVVTPNLVIERNYVMNIEYPNAIEKHKNILPIESVKTDKNLLKENFKNIPEMVSVSNSKDLSKKLLANLKNVALSKNNDPEHLYYMGLAYLNGIDVEVNREKGINLIEEAANTGYEDAIVFLYEAYSIGNGVKVNLKKAIFYAEKRAEIYRKKENHTEDDFLNYLHSLLNLLQFYIRISDKLKVEKIYSEFESYDFREIESDEEQNIFLYHDQCTRLQMYSMLYLFYIGQNMKTKALEVLNRHENYFESIEILWKNEKENLDDLLKDKFLLYNNLYNYYCTELNHDKSEKYFKKAEKTLNKLLKIDNCDDNISLKISFSTMRIANLINSNKNIEALILINSTLDLINKLKLSSYMINISKAQIIFQKGQLLLIEKKPLEAEASFLEFINLVSPNYEPIEENSFNMQLFLCYHCLAVIYKNTNPEKFTFFTDLTTEFGKQFYPNLKDCYYTGKVDYYYDNTQRFIGDFKYGFKHGYGKLIFSNDTYYEGEFVYDEYHGKGKIVYSNGVTYEGEWKNDKKNGKGKQVWTDGAFYNGEWKDNKLNGYGKMVWENGDTYEGEWKNDYRNGFGKLIYANSTIEKGYFENGYYIGDLNPEIIKFLKDDEIVKKCNEKKQDIINYGTYTYNNGDIYTGGFNQNKTRQGYGKYYYKNGNVYIGDFVEGCFEGQGILFTAQGSKHECEWKRGLPNGFGKFYKVDGKLSYEGQWRNGFKHGYGKEYDEIGNLLFKGEWINGVKPINGIYTFSNGVTYCGDVKDGKMSGKGVITYSTGDMYDGEMLDGYRHGKGKMLWANGDHYEGDFIYGKRDGMGVYTYSNGQVYSGEWKDDKKHGYGKICDKDGNLIYEGNFENGKRAIETS